MTAKIESQHEAILTLQANLETSTQEAQTNKERADAAIKRADDADTRAYEMNERLNALQAIAYERAVIDTADLVKKIEHMPRKVTEVMDMLAELFHGRMVFLDEAYSSAKKINFNVAEAWDMLAAMGLYIPEICRDANVNDIEEEFKHRCGYELSLRDSKITNASSEFTELRERTWQGRTIDITPHVKAKGRNSKFRIHFYYDHDTDTVVIGHVGDHIESAGTRRRKI